MRNLILLLAFTLLAGGALAAWLILPGGSIEERASDVASVASPEVSRPQPTPEPLSLQKTAEPAGRSGTPVASATAETHRPRSIAPDKFAPPEIDSARLQRVAPRAPLTPKPDYASPDSWKPERLFQPVAQSAGTLIAEGHSIRLAGIVPTPIDETCAAANGEELPCGRLARTAFRRWVRGRAITCNVPPSPQPGEIVTSCTLGKTDLATWLVESGWAKAEPGSPLSKLQAQAEANGLGLSRAAR